jgi:hypothetical protein
MAIIKTPAQSPSPRRTTLGGRSVGHFSRDNTNVAPSAYLYVARIASLPRRRSRTPLTSPLPLSLPLPHAPFLIDNFKKSRAIRNHVQPTQNKHHHYFLIDNFYGRQFPFSSPRLLPGVVHSSREEKLGSRPSRTYGFAKGN